MADLTQCGEEMVFDPLPYCRSLAGSPNRADRTLWLRIATDVLSQIDTRPADVLGGDWERAFETSLDRVDEASRLESVQKLVKSRRLLARQAQAFLKRSDAAAVWMLQHSEGLPGAVLAEAAASHEGGMALAGRPDLDAQMISALVAEAPLEALIELAGNARVALSRADLRILAELAETLAREDGDPRLAHALLSARALTIDHAQLFLEASAEQRGRILLAAQRASIGRRTELRGPLVEPPVLAEFERLAIEGHFAAFVKEFAAALGCGENLAARMIADPSGEPLIVALAAIGAPDDLRVRIVTAFDMLDGAHYARLATLSRIQGVTDAATARVVLAAFAKPALPMADGSANHARRDIAVSSRPPVDSPRARRVERPAASAVSR